MITETMTPDVRSSRALQPGPARAWSPESVKPAASSTGFGLGLLEHHGLAGREDDRTLPSGVEELGYCTVGARAVLGGVVVEHDRPTGDRAWVGPLARLEHGLVEVGVDVTQAEGPRSVRLGQGVLERADVEDGTHAVALDDRANRANVHVAEVSGPVFLPG